MKKLMTNFYPFVLILLIGISFSDNSYAAGSDVNKQQEKSIKILTVGNSFADNACQWLEPIAASVPGYNISVTKANIGGCSLEKHVSVIESCKNNSESKPYYKKYCLQDLLVKDEYDYITIQQVSTLSFKPESFQPWADSLISYIKRYSPDSEIIIHQTWAYAPESKRYATWNMSREQMHEGLVESYNQLADQLELEIIPSGEAFYKATTSQDDIYLWRKDAHHANDEGCYLAGCVWFGKLLNVSPKKVNYVPEEMDNKTAKFLRKMAHKTLNEL